ncbi:hypothetical protein EYF80_013337 [Liparis tanakae]|uniref:Uncharacterized protein n=1 Tax=Liparis tanakae TaxID=230148 RepID=A0A4Z2IGM8_9TELE|nr:hypothetical protein EYF80_013337 [Liparis tanakae]
MSGASRTVELEVPASRLAAPTSATHSTGSMAASKDTRERSVRIREAYSASPPPAVTGHGGSVMPNNGSNVNNNNHWLMDDC